MIVTMFETIETQNIWRLYGNQMDQSSAPLPSVRRIVTTHDVAPICNSVSMPLVLTNVDLMQRE